MLYLIVAEDNPGTLAQRRAVRPEHLGRLEELQQQGRLVLAGPMPAIDSPDPGEAGFIGSAIVAEFDSLEAAEAWAQQDPYVAAGVYRSVTVRPYIRALP
ncbi:MAG: YciI family protein [Spongiibacteraceae bacterium]|jgi:uncharacterized protein YciI|nr:YciI family protein [Spongiibacteraceae bacterium]